MKYKAYPKYKDSGVEWLGEVPEHWEVKQFRYLFNLNTGLSITRANLLDEGIPCVSYGEVHSRYGFEVNPDIHSLKFVSKEYLKTSQKALLSEGDFIFADTSEDLEGSGNFSRVTGKTPVFAGYHTIVARNVSPLNTKFFAYLFDSKFFRKQIQLSVKGVKVFSITQAILRDSYTWYPPLPEQQRITDFLDKTTAKINGLITKQEKLIHLLDEKRQAIISHAVTKGLNPNAPMKDSGIDWLGEVPEHWQTKQFRYLFNLNTGLSITRANLLDKGIPCVSYGEVHSRYGFEVNADIHSLKFVSEEYLKTSQKALLKEGDFIFADTSEDLEGSGNFSRIRGNTPVFAGYHTIVARNAYPLDTKFFAYLFDSTFFRKQIQLAVKGVKVFSITQAILKDCFTWYPPPPEQQQIADYLDQKTAQIDLLVEKAKQQITLLKERRTALISATVTGKIDVRDYAA